VIAKTLDPAEPLPVEVDRADREKGLGPDRHARVSPVCSPSPMTPVLDPLFAPPRSPPFPPGEGPFRQKGNGYRGDLEYIDAHVPGGRQAVIGAVGSEPLRAFLRQPFVGSEWYDAYPCAVLHASAARLRGLEFPEHRRQVGAYHASAAVNAIYRSLLRVVSNRNIALWGPRISSIYFEFGRSETVVVGRNEVLGVRSGIPAGLVQFVAFASKGFCEQTLVLAGAKTASMEIEGVERDGSAHGQANYKCTLRIRWT
jgi:hypothetical protein